jgi:hypothetical protein
MAEEICCYCDTGIGCPENQKSLPTGVIRTNEHIAAANQQNYKGRHWRTL